MGSIARGFDIIAARKKSSAWGTAVSVNNSGDQIPLLTFTVEPTVNYILDESLTGKAYRNQSQKGAITAEGSMTGYMRYDGLEIDIAMVMGRASTPTQVVAGGAPNAYYTDYRLGDSLESYMITLAIDKQVSIEEFDSLKYNGLTISGEAGNRLAFDFQMLGRAVAQDTGTNASLSAVTEPLPRIYMLFEHCKFLMNTASGIGLAAGVDDVYPASFSISIVNNLAGDLTSENDPYVDEPLRSTFGDITGTLTIPKFKDLTSRNAFIDGTVMKMAIKIVSTTQIVAAGNGPYYYEFNMYFPNIVITEAPRGVDGPGNVPGTFNFRAERASSAPNGMDGVGNRTDSDEARSTITDPIVMEIKNTASGNPLA